MDTTKSLPQKILKYLIYIGNAINTLHRDHVCIEVCIRHRNEKEEAIKNSSKTMAPVIDTPNWVSLYYNYLHVYTNNITIYKG